MILKTSQALYAHIDCNCFFVSCERVRNQNLNNIPVVVAGDIILASSYECKKYGVATGMPVWTAKKLMGSSLIVCPPDLSYYRLVSQKFFHYLKEIFGHIEPFSIDETFIYLGEKNIFLDFEENEKFIQELQQDILLKIGIPVSIGVANTRIKAKIFSNLRKPLGYYISEEENDREQFEKLPTTATPFIARGTQEKLGIGVKTIADFMELPYFHIKRLLGKHGVTLWLELHGVDVWRSANLGKTQKSLVRSRSYSNGLTDNREIVWRRLCENFDSAYQDLIVSGLTLQEIGIFFRTKEFEKLQGIHFFHESVNDKKILIDALKELFLGTWKTGYMYRTTGIFFGKISNGNPRQLSLFENFNQTQEKNSALEETLVNLKKRYGKRIIQLGKTQYFE